MSLSARTHPGSANPRTHPSSANPCTPTGSANPHTQAGPAAGTQTVWTATGHERPVFLDEHGRRRRWVLLGGALSGGASACWLAALVAGAIGFSTMPSLHERSQLLASRTAVPAHARPPGGRSPSRSGARRRRHPAGSRNRGGASPLNNTTELAVSRALIAPR